MKRILKKSYNYLITLQYNYGFKEFHSECVHNILIEVKFSLYARTRLGLKLK